MVGTAVAIALFGRNTNAADAPASPADNGNNANNVVVVKASAYRGDPVKTSKGKGPLWFQKMDINHDGDLSRREFLGTDEDFKRIDRDGDGLISAAEAEAYDREVRPVATRKKK